jgi:predicted glycoside hydrolase/deacetylase ChbG (UPF0249 family)
MKYLIVNADDFGASRGINRGIIEAHRRGIVTSTSLMVDRPGSEEAAFLSQAVPDLGVGLHIDFANEGAWERGRPARTGESCRAELRRQFRRFQELIGCPPTHLDSHRNVHRDPGLLPHFADLARQYGLPLREHCPTRYFSQFYGQWGGATHLEQISVDNLLRMLETEIQEDFTELSCHPGYVDPDLHSGYSHERETELRTLCDPAVRKILAERQIQLMSFRDLNHLVAGLPG